MINKKDFEFLYNEYYSGLCAYAFRFLNLRSAAEDIVQDVFCLLWKNKDKVEIQYSAKSYLFLSVKNKCLDYIKHNNIHERYKEIMQQGGEVSLNFTWEHFVEKELKAYVENILGKLPDNLRELFLLNKVEGKTAKTIAFEKGIPVRTVEGQIARAIKILKENSQSITFIISLICFYFTFLGKK